MSRHIPESIERKLYAESMGRCMNPDCEKELFLETGDLIERAHIIPYCEAAENSFENLIVLCPNCHTNFDKNCAYTIDEVKTWKDKRQAEIEKIFCKKYSTFKDLEREAKPLLAENKSIYENYYLNDNRILWDKFEGRILANNSKLKLMLMNNIDLFQTHREKELSNLEIVYTFIQHIDEFAETRSDTEKRRQIMFPKKINSIFGISPVNENLIPSIDFLQNLVKELQSEGKFCKVVLGVDDPYLMYTEDGNDEIIFLKDAPRLRQKYYEYKCFAKITVRLDSLNFALKYLNTRGIRFEITDYSKLNHVKIKGYDFLFVYEYCLSKAQLIELAVNEGVVIVNLHNWNGSSCISEEAHDLSRKMNVQLLTMDNYYGYVCRL